MPRKRAHPIPPLEQRIGAALLLGRDDEGVVVVENGRVAVCTRVAGQLLGCEPLATVGLTFDEFLETLEGDLVRLQFASLLLEQPTGEFVAPRPGRADEWIEVRRLPLPPDVAFLLRDVTARELSDRTLQMLVHELNHRVKNMLATVQSIARRSLHAAESAGAARDFEDRLMAVGGTYDLLTRERWAGAELHEVIRRTLSPHLAVDSSRLTVDGPDLWLQPNRALSVALALHELATNAVKYGALSGDTGRITLRWRVDSHPKTPQLDLEWLERDGPVVRMPRRRGFGSRLIERSLARDLGGQVTLAFEPAGVRCRITAPIEAAAG
jgi:two-component sensor histidine kinase